jgi:hypothetical protein
MQRHGGTVERDGIRKQLIEIGDGADGSVALVSLGVTESLAGIVCRATK